MALFDSSFTEEDFEEHSNDQDFLLALQLHNELNPDHKHEKPVVSKASQIPAMSVVDKRWELIDPNPNIYELFQQFNDQFFYSQLGSVYVEWSKRMTRCAGICYYRRGGECRIALSASYLTLRPRKDLVETLLHEMIHAYLFVTHNNRDRDGHGPEFLKHMVRINDATGANITVYHSFHDEYDHLHGHWWRCTGPCRQWKPFYGYVKRSMNRAPSNRDRWWAEHERRCGGQFEKIKEPDNYKGKDSKKQATEEKESKTKTSPTKKKKASNPQPANQEKIEKFFKKTKSITTTDAAENPTLKRNSDHESEERTAKIAKTTEIDEELKPNYVKCLKCDALLPKSNLFIHGIRCNK